MSDERMNHVFLLHLYTVSVADVGDYRPPNLWLSIVCSSYVTLHPPSCLFIEVLCVVQPFILHDHFRLRYNIKTFDQ